jgi:hypothetical protein
VPFVAALSAEEEPDVLRRHHLRPPTGIDFTNLEFGQKRFGQVSVLKLRTEFRPKKQLIMLLKDLNCAFFKWKSLFFSNKHNGKAYYITVMYT